MEQQEITVDAPEYTKFTLRLPTDLLDWFRQQAKAKHRKITGEMVVALEAYRKLEEDDNVNRI
jgi:hypothetical protein